MVLEEAGLEGGEDDFFVEEDIETENNEKEDKNTENE